MERSNADDAADWARLCDLDPDDVAEFVDFDTYKPFVSKDFARFLVDPPGREPYQLYAYAASLVPKGGLIADLGTYQGLSALACAVGNPDATVVTYDIDDHLCEPFADACARAADDDGAVDAQAVQHVLALPNVVFKQRNVFDALDEICEADLIVLDIDPHDGKQERRFVDAAAARGFRGALLCDDIYYRAGMRGFWNAADGALKADLSKAGHRMGTGLLVAPTTCVLGV